MTIEVPPDWWKSLFDEVYLLTDARTVADDELTRREVDLFIELLGPSTGDRILDLCGGQGRHSLELARRGFERCTVFDYSAKLLVRGRQAAAGENRRVAFVQGDATVPGLKGDSFDYVLVLGNSLGYLPQASDDLQILSEARRLLRPGGRLLLEVTDGAAVRERFNPNAWHEVADGIVVCRQRSLEAAAVRCRELVLCKQRGVLRDRTYAIRTYSVADLEKLMVEAGLDEIAVKQGFVGRQTSEDRGFMNHRLLVRRRKTAG